jgi:hypothetical protein
MIFLFFETHAWNRTEVVSGNPSKNNFAQIPPFGNSVPATDRFFTQYNTFDRFAGLLYGHLLLFGHHSIKRKSFFDKKTDPTK